jgi:hypothetical protein
MAKGSDRSSDTIAVLVGRMRAARSKAIATLASRPPLPPIPTRDNLTPDHPLSRAFGLEQARELVDPQPPQYVREAAARRAVVLELSLAGRRVREIADHVGLTYYSTVKVRGRLRQEGKLR